MEELFRDFWWLIFPIWGLAMGAWHSMAAYRRQKAMLDLVRTYADKGQQPPEALLAALGRDDVGGRSGRNSPAHYWSLAALFGVLAIPALYLVGRRLIGTRAALFGALMLTVSGLHVFYSQFARYWSLVFLLSAIYPYAIYAMFLARQRD